MRLSYKYRIYPNKSQEEALLKSFNFCRFLYNCALEERISYYKTYHKSRSYYDQQNTLKEVKDLFPESKSIYSQTLQNTLQRVDTAYSNFFRRVKKKDKAVGFPRFKGKGRLNSITFPQCDFYTGGVKLNFNWNNLKNSKIKIYGIEGEILIKYSRFFEGNCKQVTIKKENDQYFAILSCDKVPLITLPKTNKKVAIDLGLNSFITTDNNVKINHPKPYKKFKNKIAILNRKLALKKRGSKNRYKAKIQLAKTYKKVSNIRDHFLHQTANKLIKENDKIIMEDLNIKSMMENKNSIVNKGNISDASWDKFSHMLSYKAERADRIIVKVNPRNTSKMCCWCSQIKDNLTLKDRIYICKYCHLQIDRDYNAAINISRLEPSLVLEPKVLAEKHLKCLCQFPNPHY